MDNKQSNLIEEMQESTLLVTISRESKLNALNRQTLRELHEVLSNALHNKAISGVILTGAGDKAFVAGADISEFADFSVEEGRDLAREGQSEVFDLIHNASKPIVAAINGFALGGGLELAMACHIRIASSEAKMGLPEVSLGLIPGYGGTQRLTQLVGRGRALEMILTGEMIDAKKALHFGLINRMVAPEELLNTARALLITISKRSPSAISAAIRSVNAALENHSNGFAIEIEEFAARFGTADFIEGVSAFLGKRQPEFRR